MGYEREADTLIDAIHEAERFVKMARKAVARTLANDVFGGTKEMGAAKRASMDLTRALAKVRAK